MALARLKKFDKKIWWGLAAAAIVALAVVYFYGQFQAKNTVAYQTQAVERADLTASVGATGTVRAGQFATLTWQTTGRVDAVGAGIGDTVEADQVLASLAQGSLSQGIVLSASDLISAQNELETLLFSNLALAQAEQDLSNAKQAVEDAQAKYDGLSRPRVSDELLEQITEEIQSTQAQLDRITWIYNRFYDYENMADGRPAKAEMTLNLLNIQNSLNSQIARYNWYTSVPDEIELEKWLAALTVAQARQADAQREVDRLLNGQNAQDIAAAQAQADAAQATLNLAKVIAPFHGIITEANPQPGDLVSPGEVAFRVEDLSRLYVDLEISEIDINAIAPGQLVSLIFDAIPDKTYTGQVVKVDLVGQVSSGSVIFPVTVELTEIDPLVKPGMTAAVMVTVKEVQNVLIVPNRAVRVLDGERVVYILKDNQPVPVKIRLGTTTDFYSEVVSDTLSEGDLLVLNPAIR